MYSRMTIIGLAGVVVLLAAGAIPAQAAENGRSPAVCGPLDTPETGIQGDSAAGHNCGLTLLGEVSGASTAVQGAGHCAYVRIGGGMSSGAAPLPNVQIKVIDLSDPTAPTEIRTVQTLSLGSETMRALVTDQRALLVSGRSVFDISDCENPVLKGEIEWPGIAPWPAGASHDIRVSHDGKKVYAGMYVIEVDISDLEHPSSWTVKNHTCSVAAQENGSPPTACDDGAWEFASTYSHGPDDNKDGTRLYVGNQQGSPKLRILDITVNPARVISSILESPGHSMDWFRTADGREFLLHANELDTGDTCAPHPRSSALGWAYEAFLTDITDEKAPRRASLVELAINKPEFCAVRQSSGNKPWIAYHSVDNPYNASFAMVSFGSAGLRVFDIRDPYAPKEVAYFNGGALAHAGVSHYDAARGLILVPGNGLRVLEIEPQVFDRLGLPYPTDPAYPRYLPEPGFGLSLASGLALLATLRPRPRRHARPSPSQ